MSDVARVEHPDDEVFRKAVAAAAGAIVANKSTLNAAARPAQAGTSWSNQGTINTGLIGRLTQNLAASFGRTPQEVEDALAYEGLSWGPPFPPGRPLDPYYGIRRPPRTWDFPVGDNIQITPRYGRISFQTIKAIIDSYYAAQICVRHLINDVRSLDYQFVPPQNVLEDVSDDVALAEAFFVAPDRRQPFRSWIAEFLQDVLRYDAGTLYIRRDNGGRPIALEVVSGPTMIPLIDFFGREPMDEPTDEINERISRIGGIWEGTKVPAYLQIIEGMPWVWLMADDIIYQPLNPLPESQYGLAPMEAVLLQANTDIRFQWFFLQHFTEGTVPAGFMQAPPDLSDPAQIEDWQSVWDAVMFGDQSKLSQIRWVPAGSQFQQVKDESFDSAFSLYLMRCTAATFGVTPNDLGFTEDVNRSTGEIQQDVNFRVGTLPIVRYVEDIINIFIHQHLHLKARIQFDTGQGTQHRLEDAQANKILIDSGVLSTDEVRMQLGKRVSRSRPTPRFINNTRSGPIALRALEVMAGDTDGTTYGPARNAPILHVPWTAAPGVLPIKGSPEGKDATQYEGRVQTALLGEKSPTKQPKATGATPKAIEAAKEGPATAGIAADTGVAGVDMFQDDEDEKASIKATALLKVMRQWRENSLHRVKKGQPPRMFPDLPDPVTEAVWPRLANARSREEVVEAFQGDLLAPMFKKKMASELPRVAGGLVVQALDTGRVLLVQRTPDKHDDGRTYTRWEFPGGKLDGGHDTDTPDASVWEGAVREWSEETGATLPPDVKVVGGWASPDGYYEGFVVQIPAEAALALNPQPEEVSNVAWWDPEDLDDPVIRGKVLDALHLVEPLLKAQWSDFHRQTDKILSHYAPEIRTALSQVYAGDTVRQVIRNSYQATKAKAPTTIGQVLPTTSTPAKAPVPATSRAGATAVPGSGAAIGVGVTVGAGMAAVAGMGAAATAGGIVGVLVSAAAGLSVISLVLQRLYANGFLQGAHETADLAGGKLPDGLSTDGIPSRYWDDWTPGLEDYLIDSPPDSLSVLLQGAPFVANEVAHTLAHRIAAAIARGEAHGATEEELLDAVEAIMHDEKRAAMIAETEFQRARQAGVDATLKANYVQQVAWIHQPGACSQCMTNAAVSPIPITQSWPMGSAPVHPACRCVCVPAGRAAQGPRI